MSDHRAVSHDIVTSRYPAATSAFLAGSFVRGGWTATSDLDVVVVLPGPPAPQRETLSELPDFAALDGEEFDLAVCFGALGHVLPKEEPRFIAAVRERFATDWSSSSWLETPPSRRRRGGAGSG